VLRHVPLGGHNILDMASGPIQYDEYLEYSRNFDKRTCVDYSQDALDAARAKIADHGVFLCGNWLEIPLEADQFDCSLSLHTIYHIDKDQQEQAVRKLVHVTRPGKPVIIVYANPRPVTRYVSGALRRLGVIPENRKGANRGNLYVFMHPIAWWERFRDVADVSIVPWRSLGTRDQKLLIPDNWIGKQLFAALYKLEETFPNFFARKFLYPMIILTKR
jgi:SAM-dependent methyltransferase